MISQHRLFAALFCTLVSSNLWAFGRAPVEHLQGYCGELGTVNERLIECTKPKHEGGVGVLSRKSVLGADKKPHAWRLASKALQGPEVWMDEQTGLFWSESFQDLMNVAEAVEICTDSDRNSDVTVGIPLEFKLPEASDFETAEAHGIRSALPGFERSNKYWTQTWGNTSVYMAFYSSSGKLKGAPEKEKFRVRCVALRSGL